FGDVRHRFSVGLNSQALRNLSINLSLSAATGSPYNITTGRDDNGDFFFNDRPAGYERNAGRGDGNWTLNGNINYNFTFGRQPGAKQTAANAANAATASAVMDKVSAVASAAPMVMMAQEGGARMVVMGGAPPPPGQ